MRTRAACRSSRVRGGPDVPFDLGDTVRICAVCRDASGAPANASTVSLTVTLPDGTTATPSVTNPPTVTGEYTVDYVPTAAGLHRWRMVTTSPAWAETGAFYVGDTLMLGIVSIEETKRHLRKSVDDTADDEDLREFIAAATEVIAEHRGRTVVRTTVVEDLSLGPSLVVQLGTSPVQSLTSVATVDGATSWDVADLHLNGDFGIVTVLSGMPLRGLVRFMYVAGPAQIKANYTLAAKYIIEHLWESRLQPGVGPRGPFGAEGDMLSPTGRGFAIPNRAVELLGRRPPLVA
jgi:hypothetical protein